MTLAELEARLVRRRAIRDRVKAEWLRGDQPTARLEAEREYVAMLERELEGATR
jgi:hypothetical protein